MEKQINQEHVSVAEYLAYFSYGFGQCFSFGIIGSFILIYYTDIVGISSVIASAIFLICTTLGRGVRSDCFGMD